jgi:hypothetical protein
MKAKELIIDGVNMIGTFYSQVLNDNEQEMWVSEEDTNECDWYRVEEFGYSKIICWFYRELTVIEYENVKSVRIGKWDYDLEDFKYYIYTNNKN